MVDDETHISGGARRARPPKLIRWWSLALYALLVVALSWPLAIRPGSAIPGGETDAYVHLWTFDWLADALGRRPFTFHTDRIFFPAGVSMLNHNIAWLNAAAWGALLPLTGSIAAYTLSMLFFLWLNGAAVHHLVGEITGSWRSALLGGLVATMWPAILTELNHPNLVAMGFVPLSMLALLRLARTRRRRYTILAGLCIGLIGITRLQLLVMAAPLIGAYTLFLIVRFSHQSADGREEGGAPSAVPVPWRALVGVGVIAGALALLPAAPILFHQATRANPADLFVTEIHDPQVDLAHFLLPNDEHPLWGDLIARLFERTRLADFPLPPGYFLGFTVLFLATAALLSREREALFWALAAGMLAFLSLGPDLHLFGTAVRVPLYSTLYRRYLLPWLREPRRFAVLLVVPMSVLAGLGWSYLRRRGRPRRAWWAFAVLIPLEFWLTPFPTLSVDTPAWYGELAEMPEAFGVMSVPTGRQHSELSMFYQLTHVKGLVDGHVSRPPEQAFDFIEEVPLLADLRADPGGMPPEDLDIRAQLWSLYEADIHYVILHRWYLSDDEEAAWGRVMAVPPVHEDRDLTVYATDPLTWAPIFEYYQGHQDRIHAVDVQLGSWTTIPGGWVEVTVTWYVPSGAADAGNRLCLSIVGPEFAPMEEDCGYRVRQLPGDELVMGLHTSTYLIQTGATWSGGLYALRYTQLGADRVSGWLHPFEVETDEGRFAVPTPAYPYHVVFGHEIRLMGYDYVVSADELAMTLYWHAQRRPAASYRVFIHLVDEVSGEVVTQSDHVPVDWQYPTDIWSPGEYVRDPVTLDLRGVPPGAYRVQVGLYRPEGGGRLATDPEHWQDAAVLMYLER